MTLTIVLMRPNSFCHQKEKLCRKILRGSILELEEKVCEISHKYQKLSPVEKAEVEQYLRIRLQGAASGSMLDLLRRLFIE